jgi:hypothetical protein
LLQKNKQVTCECVCNIAATGEWARAVEAFELVSEGSGLYLSRDTSLFLFSVIFFDPPIEFAWKIDIK